MIEKNTKRYRDEIETECSERKDSPPPKKQKLCEYEVVDENDLKDGALDENISSNLVPENDSGEVVYGVIEENVETKKPFIAILVAPCQNDKTGEEDCKTFVVQFRDEQQFEELEGMQFDRIIHLLSQTFGSSGWRVDDVIEPDSVDMDFEEYKDQVVLDVTDDSKY